MATKIATESTVVDGKLVRGGRSYDDGKPSKKATKAEIAAATKDVDAAKQELGNAASDADKAAAQAKLDAARAKLAELEA